MNCLSRSDVVVSCLEAYRTSGQPAGESCPKDIVEVLLVLFLIADGLDCYRGLVRRSWYSTPPCSVFLSSHNIRSRWL